MELSGSQVDSFIIMAQIQLQAYVYPRGKVLCACFCLCYLLEYFMLVCRLTEHMENVCESTWEESKISNAVVLRLTCVPDARKGCGLVFKSDL